MANLKDLRAKIVSTKKTQQTTRAMKMVSAAKLKRAQDNIVQARPYALKLSKFIKQLSANPEISHPLLEEPAAVTRVLLVVMTSDRGLCGGFNNNILKHTEAYLRENKSKYEKIDIIFVGRKGADHFKKRNVLGIDQILNLSRVINYSIGADIATRLLKSYSSGEYHEVHIIYNEFKSAIAQNVVDERLLPVRLEGDTGDDYQTKDFVFEPNANQILDDLLKKHFAIQVYRCLQESVASEHGARMSAMENATKNAGEMIRSLTLTYNKARQAKITTELIEITSGAEAL
jgi:F-type H+-transporting ATPase subunit gamma